jgi:hypothetical protein
MRSIRLLLAVGLLAGACTRTPDEPSPTSPTPATTGSPSVVETGARLPDGSPLPTGCTGGAGPSDTVAFVADGRAWAIDPSDGDLACLFPVADPGPFAWGPQGDRVLLSDFRVRGVGGDAPDLPPVPTTIGPFDWGHPVGLAIVFADDRGVPRKRFLPEGNLVRLTSLPPGDYLEVAYHPSGLALAFVVETPDGQEIWLSTNEGEDPQRLVFSETGTEFTSLAFSANGKTLWWTAQHAEGYPELHFMQLENRSGFGTAWRGTEGTVADGLRLPPSGDLEAVTEGEACVRHRALIIDGGSTTRALPEEPRPSEALGWLDEDSLLVGVGGCGGPVDLYAVDAIGEDRAATPLVFGVEIANPRTVVTNPPKEVPAPPDEELPSSGVG